MNLTELEKLADAVYDPIKDDWELKQALLHFDRAANPQTVKHLIALLRQAKKLLETAQWREEHGCTEAPELYEDLLDAIEKEGL